MRSKKVLIVDDDPQIRKILERLLGTLNYQLDSAPDGAHALEKVSQIHPDLIILDIMMPDMSGIEVCRRVREEYSSQAIKVMMLSAKDSQADRRRALEYGADEYVTKPFHLASLARKIQHLFEKKRSEVA